METDIIILVFTHYEVNGLYVFICVFCYVPCKEGAEFPCHRLMSRLVSCSIIVTLNMVFLKSRNSQRVCRVLLICIA